MNTKLKHKIMIEVVDTLRKIIDASTVTSIYACNQIDKSKIKIISITPKSVEGDQVSEEPTCMF